jgi:hypothetical protein
LDSSALAELGFSGDTVIFEHTDSYCTIQVNGTLMSGCLMNGYMQGMNQCAYLNKFSNFIGLRLQ